MGAILDEPVEPRESALITPKMPEEKSWATGAKVEIALLISAFASMIGGLVLERANVQVSAQICFTIAYLTGGYFGFTSAIRSLRKGVVDVDLLMVLAALGAAYVGSAFEGAMLLFLFAFSNVLQDFAFDRTRSAIRALANLRPKVALVIRDDSLVATVLAEVLVGERFLVRPGDLIALDGEVVEGDSEVNQASVTGESMPVHKKLGSKVFAGTQNLSGSLTIRVTNLEKDSTLAKMIQMVEEAHGRKAESQRFLERYEQVWALFVIVATIALIIVMPLLFRVPTPDGIYRAITFMVVASPCALVISTPATILSAIGNGARKGILIKGGAQLERAAKITRIALDKTGTLTTGEPEVDQIRIFGALSEAELLAIASSVEAKSEHPLAQTIVRYANQKEVAVPPIQAFQAVIGKGAQGELNGEMVYVGSPKWFAELAGTDHHGAFSAAADLEAQGSTSILVGRQSGGPLEILGVIALADQLRPGAAEAVTALRSLNIQQIAMLTGDAERVAQAIGARAGIQEIHASLLPDEKVAWIAEEAKAHAIAMVGDGTNDAPALAVSSLGIAMGAAGSDVALETADVVLMSSDISNVPYLLMLSRKARTVVTQNLVFAGGVLIAMMILSLVLPAFGHRVPLPLGVVAHEGGTVLVCLNGLRLLLYRPPA